jgi:hypothetical protein
MQPREVYKRFNIDIEKHSLGWHEMKHALHQAHADGDFDRIVLETPEWPQRVEMFRTYGNPSTNQASEWFNWVRMGLDGGYYALALVDHAQKGQAPDHWVLIVGAREVWPDGSEGGGIDHEVLVSCSSRSTPDEEWVEVHRFLKNRGGFNPFLARPAR